MHVLVTGGAGFIGSHLAESLLRQKCRVWVIDNLATGSKKNISHLLGKKNFTFVFGDASNKTIMKKLISECDIVYHLAAVVGVKNVTDNPLKTIEVNYKTTENMLKLLRQFRRRAIIASSSEIYGQQAAIPLVEDATSILGPVTTKRWGYAASKLLCEFLSMAYRQTEKLPITIVRFFNVCGPRQTGRYGMVVPRFLEQALHQKPIVIYGDGRQTRTFVDVADAVDGLIRVAHLSTAEEKNIYNLGGVERISMEALAKMIKKITHSNSKITYLPPENVYGKAFQDVKHRVPDISEICRVTGYYPHMKIEETLRRTADWMRSEICLKKK